MNKTDEEQPDVAKKVTDKKRICEMSGKEFLKALAQIEVELKGARDSKRKRK